jgi:hypothetical protein
VDWWIGGLGLGLVDYGISGQEHQLSVNISSLILIPIIILASCNQRGGITLSSQDKVVNETFLQGEQLIGDTILGDFDGDGKKEFLWVISAIDSVANPDHYGKMLIRCSDKKIRLLNTEREFWEGYLYNEGDLNEDGKDDFSVVVHNEGSWGSCLVYTLKHHHFVKLVPGFTIWDGLGQENIYKDPSKKGYVIYQEWIGGDSIWVKTHSVKVD